MNMTKSYKDISVKCPSLRQKYEVTSKNIYFYECLHKQHLTLDTPFNTSSRALAANAKASTF